MAKIQGPKEGKTYSNIYKEEWIQPWPMGSKIYPKVHENPRAFFSSSSPSLLESSIQFPWGVRIASARDMVNQEEWVPFMDVLALLIFGLVLFPNVDGLVDLAAIDAFLAYHHSKESPVVAILTDLFDTFDRRCEKSSARIIYCLPALCVWLV